MTEQPATSLFTTAATRAEILYGLRLLPNGRRSDRLYQAVTTIFDEDFSGRVLAFDKHTADLYADLVPVRKRPVGRSASSTG